MVPHSPPHPAPCLHLTHLVFNQVSPTTHSLNASAAKWDVRHLGRAVLGSNRPEGLNQDHNVRERNIAPSTHINGRIVTSPDQTENTGFKS